LNNVCVIHKALISNGVHPVRNSGAKNFN